MCDLVVAVTLTLAACSPNHEKGGGGLPGGGAAPTTTSTVSTPAAAPAAGGHLRPSPVLFGSKVMVPEASGALRDVTPQKTGGESIVDAFFVDPDHGWVVLNDFGRSAGRLVRTADGGRSWDTTDLRFSQHPSAGSFVHVWFLDANHGWVTSYTATANAPQGVAVSTDGGRTWPWFSGPPRDESEILHGLSPGPIRFATPTHGWVAGGNAPGARPGLFETVDAGRSWKERSVGPPPGGPGEVVYQLPNFFGRRGVLAVGVSGNERLGFYTSSDSGRTWRLSSTFREAGSARGSVAIASPELWWIISDDAATVFKTSDAGRSWQRTPTSGLSGVVIDIDAGDGSRAWVRTIEAGRATMGATTDGGATWRPLLEP